MRSNPGVAEAEWMAMSHFMLGMCWAEWRDKEGGGVFPLAVRRRQGVRCAPAGAAACPEDDIGTGWFTRYND